ncbi:MAG TPA: hypothetical protein VL307_03845, partial [Chitinophagaceae bacterium]|nr:hypothetical protein [Chitinophagaceae bacterium]
MKKFFTLFVRLSLPSLFFILSLFVWQQVGAQPCPITLAASVQPSDCEASGSISVYVGLTAPGGSTLKYSIIQAPPLFPASQLNHQQSSNFFGALPSGNYQIAVDLTRGALQCRKVIPVRVGGNYVPMQLNFSTSDNTQCGSATADGRIQLTASNGRPYSSGYKYELLSPAAFQASNTTGTFDQLPAGIYTVRAYDSCGNFQTRDISIANTRSTYNFDAYL